MKTRLCLGALTWVEPAIPSKASTWSAVNFKKNQLTTVSSKLEPAIWSRDTGQRMPCFDRCQLVKTWMSNIKDVCCKLVCYWYIGIHGRVDVLTYGPTSFPGSLFSASLGRWKRDPGCGWSRDHLSIQNCGGGGVVGTQVHLVERTIKYHPGEGEVEQLLVSKWRSSFWDVFRRRYFGWLWRYKFVSETSHLPGKFIFKERLSCCSSYRLREILCFPSSASIVEGKRENTCNHKPYINLSQQSKKLFWCLVLKHDFSAKTTESSDIPLSLCLSKFVTVTVKNPVTPPFQQREAGKRDPGNEVAYGRT